MDGAAHAAFPVSGQGVLIANTRWWRIAAAGRYCTRLARLSHESGAEEVGRSRSAIPAADLRLSRDHA